MQLGSDAFASLRREPALGQGGDDLVAVTAPAEALTRNQRQRGHQQDDTVSSPTHGHQCNLPGRRRAQAFAFVGIGAVSLLLVPQPGRCTPWRTLLLG